jgi:hypothetical protein
VDLVAETKKEEDEHLLQTMSKVRWWSRTNLQ